MLQCNALFHLQKLGVDLGFLSKFLVIVFFEYSRLYWELKIDEFAVNYFSSLISRGNIHADFGYCFIKNLS